MDMNTKNIREALGAFATGITVITAHAAGRDAGMTANSFTSVSLDPALVLFCVAKTSTSRDVFLSAQEYSIHILGDQQGDLAKHFAVKGGDKFAGVNFARTEKNTPVLDGCVASLRCEKQEQIEAGDHIVIIASIADYSYSKASPLLFVHSRFVSLEAEKARKQERAGTLPSAVSVPQ